MADVFYLAAGIAGAAVATALVAGAGSQIASDHRRAIARVWRGVSRPVGAWVLYALTQVAPVLPALAARMPRWHRAAAAAHRHRRLKNHFGRRAALTTITTSGGTR